MPVIDSDVLKILATKLQKDGTQLANHLKLNKDKQMSPLLLKTTMAKRKQDDQAFEGHRKVSEEEAENDERRTRSLNLEILSTWMSHMVAMPKSTAVLQLVNALIKIGREDLLEYVLNKSASPFNKLHS